MKTLEKEIDTFVECGLIENVAVRVGRGDEILYDTFRGDVSETTLFDMASVTKIIATTSLALIALDRGLLSLDDCVCKFFSTDKKITVKNLLTHTIGIGYKELYKESCGYDAIAEKILEIPSDIPVGSEVRYSCPGFILLGKILEKVFGKRLDKAFDELVAKPLEMTSTSFLTSEKNDIVNANLTEEERGIVNDYNCRSLGGVAGNAGVFSNLSDMTKYARALICGFPLISRETFDLAVKNYTADKSESRGLGYLFVDGRYKQTGGLFEEGAIGHCGHTGQSVFLDYRTGLFVIILSDATLHAVRDFGIESYEKVTNMRERLHKAIKSDL